MIATEPSPDSGMSTVPSDVGTAQLRRTRAIRRAFIVILVVFVALGVSGLLGVRSRSVAAAGGGYDLRVTYPQVTRAGLAVDFVIRVSHPGGFDEPITIVQDARYFDLFDENAMHPSPDKETADGDQVTLEFEPPDGEVFTMRLDTRTGPNVQSGRRGSTALLVDDETVTDVGYRTWVLP